MHYKEKTTCNVVVVSSVGENPKNVVVSVNFVCIIEFVIIYLNRILVP
jgi:hypothetical protein